MAALSTFPLRIVKRATLKLALSTDPFPDLGKLVMACQAEMPETEYTPRGDTDKLRTGTLIEIAKALELEI